jgi:hypothetical protein
MSHKITLNEIFDNPQAFIEASDELLQKDELPQSVDGRFCVECEDQPSSIECLECKDEFCSVCFQSLHRKGKRRSHLVKRFASDTSQSSDAQPMSQTYSPEPAENILIDIEEQELTDSAASADDFKERARWIPLRLNLLERKTLRLLEAALTVSEYTDKIDVYSGNRSAKPQRIVMQIKDLCQILCGLVVACDYETGQELIQDKNFKHNEIFFRFIIIV